MNARTSVIERATKETEIALTLTLDGRGDVDVKSGIGFLDHMLGTLAFHARFDLALTCQGDLDVDDHHTAEDCALSLGQAIAEALGDRRGIRRFGVGWAPLDEALARTVIDLSGRPAPVIDLGLRRERLGGLSCENATHVLSSLAVAARAALHVDVLRGDNDHHRCEAAFKSAALALRESVALDAASTIRSTKGILS